MQSSRAPEPITPMVRHYTLNEIAEKWNVDPDTVRKWFMNEPGVLVIQKQHGRTTKRRYRTYRIPEPVLERVYRRMLNL